MKRHLKDGLTEALIHLDVDANVRNFAHRWLNEFDHISLDDTLNFLDRIDAHFEIHTANSSLTKKECLTGILIYADECIVYRMVDGHMLTRVENELLEGDETLEPIIDEVELDQKIVRQAELAILVTKPPREQADPDWLGTRLHRYRPIIPSLLVLSFIANVFALSIPFITMAVYDHVIGGGARAELPGIAIGALLLFSMMLSMKVLRSQLLTTIGHRVSREVSEAMFNRILRSPTDKIKRSPLSQLFNRINLGDRVKALFQGTLGGALLDLPFVLMFLIAIAVLGGWLVIIPLISIGLYVTLAMRSQRTANQVTTHTTVGGATRQMLIDELAHKVQFMKASNLLDNWSSRFNKASSLASRNAFNMAVHQARYTSAYYFISIGSNLAVIALGVGLIFEGLMSPGGLIATMMLISRVTSPVNMLSSSASRFPSAKTAKQSINHIMSQHVEGSYSYQHVPLPSEAPSIELDQLTVRYPNQMRPAVSGVSLKIAPGEVVAITGHMGSGKTSLLEAIAGLIPTQNGFVKVDGVNLSQYDPQLYRHWFGYRGEQPEMILTSVRDFVKDGRPVDDSRIINSIVEVGGEQWLRNLPHGLDTSLESYHSDCVVDHMIDFEGRILSHAKLLAFDFPLYLLDTPTLNRKEKEVFETFINTHRGSSTIVFTSHDKDIIKQCDQVIILQNGQAVYAGPIPDEEPTETPLTEDQAQNIEASES